MDVRLFNMEITGDTIGMMQAETECFDHTQLLCIFIFVFIAAVTMRLTQIVA